MTDTFTDEFENHLSALLHKRADGLAVLAADDVAIAEPQDVHRVTRLRYATFTVAAAMMLLAFFGMRALTNDSEFLDVAAERNPDVVVSDTSDQSIVWMEPNATEQEIELVASALRREGLTPVHVGREETFREFEEYFAESPEVLRAVEPDDLPQSFRVRTEEPAVIERLVLSMDGVLQFQHPESPPTPLDPLFLLPAGGLPDGEVKEYGPMEDGDIASALVVGRKTPTGYRDLGLIVLNLGDPTWAFQEAGAEPIAGRSVFFPDRGLEQTVAIEALPDGSHLEFSFSNEETLAAAVESTLVRDGSLRFATTGGLTVLQNVSLGSSYRTTLLTVTTDVGQTGRPDGYLGIRTQNTGGILLVLTSFDAVSETTIRGNAGFQATQTTDGLTYSGLTWVEPSGHGVFLEGTYTLEELRDIADDLEMVDEETWRDASNR